MRATNLVIGTTTLAVIGAAFAGFLVYQKIHGARNQGALRIVFNGSASGLRKGGSVTFDGVPAGVIRSIKLENPRKIVANVLLDNSAPLRKESIRTRILWSLQKAAVSATSKKPCSRLQRC